MGDGREAPSAPPAGCVVRTAKVWHREQLCSLVICPAVVGRPQDTGNWRIRQGWIGLDTVRCATARAQAADCLCYGAAHATGCFGFERAPPHLLDGGPPHLTRKPSEARRPRCWAEWLRIVRNQKWGVRTV